MGEIEMTRNIDLMGLIAMIMSLVGFVTVWVKIGIDKGRQEEMIYALKQKTEKNEAAISETKTKTHGIELRIAEFMGEIRAKFDFIKETVSTLKPKGGRCAAQK